MSRYLILLFALLASPVCGEEAQKTPYSDYIDNRSSAEDIIKSFYNAINRHEYLRAWSYYNKNTAPDYARFRDGYADTESVTLRTGNVRSEGAAGTIYSTVPVAIKAVTEAGTETVFTGCYHIKQVQPAIQDTPPFRPIEIDHGKLTVSKEGFDKSMGICVQD